jgi:hypothetical protein
MEKKVMLKMAGIGMVLTIMAVLAGCGGGGVPVEKLAEKLGKLKANTADTPYSVKLDNTVNISVKGSDINKAVQSEGKYVILDLSECSATDNELPQMSVIKDNAFLAGIVLPKSLTTIGKDAFDGCEKLTSITVAAANPAFSSADGVLFDKGKTTLILFPAGKDGSYTIEPVTKFV